MLYRKFYDELVKWHKQEKKLALLIDGARQIGKTTLIRQFAKDYYCLLYTSPSPRDRG